MRQPNDFYPTPQWCVDELFAIINFSHLRDNCQWRFAEPCRGTDAIYNRLPVGSEYAEITFGIDYLQHQWRSRPDCIITNPPFSLAKEFVEKSLKESDVVIQLLRLGFLGSYNRYKFLSDNRPDHLIVMSDRPKFSGNGTDMSDVAWFIWDKKKLLDLKEPFYFIIDKSKKRKNNESKL
jgi:hypothetical protein